MTPWQQCLMTLAEIDKRFQYLQHNSIDEFSVFSWPRNEPSKSQDASRGMVTIFAISQDNIDDMAALLGFQIFVYPNHADLRKKELVCEITNTTIHRSTCDRFITKQTSKLEATKEGLMSLVKQLAGDF